MKNVIIVLGVACVLLAGLLYSRNKGANQALEALEKECATFSNKVSEAQTKLVMNQALSADAQTNLQTQLQLRLTESAGLSNRLATLTAALALKEKELEAARTDAQRRAAQIARLDETVAALNQDIATLKPLEPQLGAAKASLASASADQESLLQDLRQVRVEKAELERSLNDPVFLRAQADRVEREAELAKKAAEGRHLSRVEKKARLELRDDGTVKVIVPPPPKQTAKGK